MGGAEFCRRHPRMTHPGSAFFYTYFYNCNLEAPDKLADKYLGATWKMHTGCNSHPAFLCGQGWKGIQNPGFSSRAQSPSLETTQEASFHSSSCLMCLWEPDLEFTFGDSS